MNSTYYDLLEVSPKATQSVISAAYRTLSQKFHPDKNNGDKHCEEMMAKINVAYAVLSDPIKRKLYDQEIGVNQEKQQAEVEQPPAPVEKTPQQTTKAEQPKLHNPLGFGLLVFIIFLIAASYAIKQSNEKQNKEMEAKSEMENNKKKFQWANAEGLLTGINSVQNFQKAQKEYEEIVQANLFFDNRAEQRLAEMYFFGLGQQKDYSKALDWYQKASINSETEFMLGMIYFEGFGVKKDWIKAYHHFNLSQSIQFDYREEDYKPNPLIQEQQAKFMFADKEEKQNAMYAQAGSGKSYYSIAAKMKKEFLDKKLTTDEINKAQNLEM